MWPTTATAWFPWLILRNGFLLLHLSKLSTTKYRNRLQLLASSSCASAVLSLGTEPQAESIDVVGVNNMIQIKPQVNRLKWGLVLLVLSDCTYAQSKFGNCADPGPPEA